MCLYPRLITNPKYKPNKKNGGNPPVLKDPRKAYVPIGCQTCIVCRKRKAREWQIRLKEEVKGRQDGIFIALTFSTEGLQKIVDEYPEIAKLTGYEKDNAICTKALRNFLELWRYHHKKSLRHFVITELGHENTEHVHMHAIVFTHNRKAIHDHWKYGNAWTGHKTEFGELVNYVNERTVNYMMKYIMKIDEHHQNYKAAIFASPGLGNRYCKNLSQHKFEGRNTNETYRNSQGFKMNLPIYYRNKAFTEAQREDLWTYKLDKGERFIAGDKVKASDTKGINKLLKYHQERQMKLGYKAPEFIWKEAEYEAQRRKLIHERRGIDEESIRRRRTASDGPPE